MTGAGNATGAHAGKRVRIGLLFDNLWDDFQARVWRGVVDEAQARNVNLLCVAGGALDSPYADNANRSIAHDLVGPHNVDGLLVMAGCLGQFVPQAVLRRYVERFTGIPMLSLSTVFDDLPSLVVDNHGGMYDLVTHFIDVHRCRRIAYIGGAENSFDAQERLQAYRRALADRGLAFDPQLVTQGDFVYESGGRAVATLVNERRVRFDALVSANDDMALDAMRALRQLGLKIPQDVRIGGFDDVKDACSAQPALTTVRQPTYEFGRRAVRDLLGWLAGDKPHPVTMLPTRLLLRGSCGCGRDDLQTVSTAPPGPLEAALPNLAARLSQRFVTLGDILGHNDWAHQLVHAYVAEHRGEHDALQRALEPILAESEDRPIEPAVWGEVLHFLSNLLQSRLPGDSALRDRAFLFANRYVEHKQAALWVEHERRAQLLQRLQQPLARWIGIREFGNVVRDILPRLGIDRAWLLLYADNVLTTHGNVWPVLHLFPQPDGHHAVHTYTPEEAPRFAATELVPGGLAHDGSSHGYNLFPLAYEDEQLGFALFEIGRTGAEVYEIVNSLLAALVKGARLREQTQHYTAHLEQDVVARTAELRLANEALRLKNREIQKLNEELQELNKVDNLTGLYSRRAFFELLRMELHRTRRTAARERAKDESARLPAEHQLFSVMMIDIDHFKRINDQHGHLVGDHVLRRIGEMLNETDILRLEHVAGRFGGEEFIVILPSTSATNAVQPARRITERLRQTEFHGKDGATFPVTLSIGISQYSHTDPSEEAVIHRADLALYHAKKHGRDRIQVYEHLPPSRPRRIGKKRRPRRV